MSTKRESFERVIAECTQSPSNCPVVEGALMHISFLKQVEDDPEAQGTLGDLVDKCTDGTCPGQDAILAGLILTHLAIQDL